ncbi:MAG: ABC transporter substrate-binding protein [Chloroflexota bacterium]
MKTMFSILLLAAVMGLGGIVQAQPVSKPPRLGYLASNSALESRDLKAFRQGLADLGYIEGKNIVIEYRSAEGKLDRLPELAAELVALKVDIIVAINPPSAHAAKNTTKTIPIVMRSTDDPVATGLVASLARPGGNITGLTSISTELHGKRLELLKEVVPQARVVAVIRNPTGRDATPKWKEVEAAGRALGLRLQAVDVTSPSDFEGAFRVATKKHIDALLTLRNPMIVNNRNRLAELAAKSRLAAIYDDRAFVEAGGLMSYGADLADLHRRAALFVDKILKGARPADLPVEQPTKFEFVVNLKTAKEIGRTIPPNVLARADRVIR